MDAGNVPYRKYCIFSKGWRICRGIRRGDVSKIHNFRNDMDDLAIHARPPDLARKQTGPTPTRGCRLSHQQVSSSSGRLRKRQRGLLRQFAKEAPWSLLEESRHGVPRRNPLLEFKFSELCLDALLGRLSGIGDRRIFAQMFLQDRTTTEVPGLNRWREVQGKKHSCRPHEVCSLRWFGL